jgi:hypothetical protein
MDISSSDLLAYPSEITVTGEIDLSTGEFSFDMPVEFFEFFLGIALFFLILFFVFKITHFLVYPFVKPFFAKR